MENLNNNKMMNKRIGRKNYILGLLFFIVSFYLIFILIAVILSKVELTDWVVPVGYLLVIPLAILIISLHIRRLHDRGHSGLWILFFYIDFWLNLFVKGEQSANQYGNVPDQNVKFFKDIFSF